jgi:hypothetical protein
MIQNLSSLLNLTREERDESVIGLYKDGKTTREITKLMRMSLRDIGVILKKVKLQADRERGYMNDDEVDMESKSKEAQAMKLFSEGKSPVEVVIKLDLAADRVRAIFQDYLELEARHDLAEIYNNLGANSLFRIIRLCEICKNLRMNEHDIYRALDIAKHGELQNLQWKVEYLHNEINALEAKKARATSELLSINKMKDELPSFLAQNRYMNQGTGFCNNNTNSELPPDIQNLQRRINSNNNDNNNSLYSPATIPPYSPEPVDEFRSFSIEANRIYGEASLSLCYRPR